MPLFSASLVILDRVDHDVAEFGESHTSSFSSTFSGTSPKEVPSMRMYAHLRSVSRDTSGRADVDVLRAHVVVQY